MNSETTNDVHLWPALLKAAEVQNFIMDHVDSDERKLVLANATICGVPSRIIAEQIKTRRKAAVKTPRLATIPGIVFPPSLNLEQSSSDRTAKFKAGFLRDRMNPERLADITGGFGVDSVFFADVFDEVISVDPDAGLNQIFQSNANVLQLANLVRITQTAEAFLVATPLNFSCIYADPSRRTGDSRVITLALCEPNLLQLLPQIFKLTDHLLVKASPLLDLSAGISELGCVSEVVVLAVDNECREVLFLCRGGFQGSPVLHAVNIRPDMEELLSFRREDEKGAQPAYSEVESYLYEPNSAILKAGAFRIVGERFGLQKLAQHTQLYTSSEKRMDFPGRVFRIEAELKSDPREIKRVLPEGYANIICRNYPLTVKDLCRKLSLREGGEKYIIAASTQKRKVLLLASRLK